ncbi:hypothetical protein WR25_08642 [Diploscapter pachys]|uniref:BolA-like protein 3 n=1 Tax=Diploscapter pachys TaxID=2018661 RepID=A0A2A2KVA2_9BILA|nr:hypothetical protein WR25_08642 [Diploscapter pachys]
MLSSGFRHFTRSLCSAASKGEKLLESELRKGIEGIKHVKVEDVSGGCGASYAIQIEAASFKGLTKVQQHRRVTDTLGEHIKNIHAVTIVTKAV